MVKIILFIMCKCNDENVYLIIDLFILRIKTKVGSSTRTLSICILRHCLKLF